MDEQLKPKKRAVREDRITLKGEALEQIKAWSDQLNERIKGTRISRSDIIDWLIRSHPSLSESDVAQLEKLHFNEVRFTQWALRQLKTAKASSLAELLKQAPEHLSL